MDPFLSIVTASFNCRKSVSQTANSINRFDPAEVQWIVADGASTDGTLEQIKAYTNLNLELISGEDTGIYDAWNKACKKIKGKWVLFLSMGDRVYPKFDLKELRVFTHSIPKNTKLIWGNVEVFRNNQFRYLSQKENLLGWEFGRPVLPHHQGVLHSCTLFAEPFPFDPSYHVAADSKFLLSVLKKWNASYFNQTVSIFEDDGISNNFSNNYKVQKEIERLCQELRIDVPFHVKHLARLNRLFNTLGNKVLPPSIKYLLRPLRDYLFRGR